MPIVLAFNEKLPLIPEDALVLAPEELKAMHV
jgi:hypothetical protein